MRYVGSGILGLTTLGPAVTPRDDVEGAVINDGCSTLTTDYKLWLS